MRGDAEKPGSAGQRTGERPQALLVALCIVLAFGLGAGTFVVAKTIKAAPLAMSPRAPKCKKRKKRHKQKPK